MSLREDSAMTALVGQFHDEMLKVYAEALYSPKH